MPPLTAFLQLVLEDSVLRDELAAAPDLPGLCALVLARAAERGFALRQEELDAAIAANRRSWLERWTDL